MNDAKRREDAQRRAEEYAPRPSSSYLMYGIVGVSLAALGLYAFAKFYGVDPLAYPVAVALGLVVIFLAAVVLRMVRSRRHAAAHRHEYNKPRPR